jgi:hypothetical protein
MARSRTLLIVFVASLLAGGCAGHAGQAHSTVQLSLDDRGKTVSLHVGDRLVITLPPASSPSPAFASSWRLGRYPTAILELQTSDATGRFEFVARAKGSGNIIAVRGCSPGPLAAEIPPCPYVAGPGSATAPPEPLIFSLTVQVT